MRCSNCHACVHKDKAIKSIGLKPLLDAGAKQDFKKAEAGVDIINLKLVVSRVYCMSCARGSKVVTSSALRVPKSCGRRILWEKCNKRLQERRRSCRAQLAANVTKETNFGKNLSGMKNSRGGIANRNRYAPTSAPPASNVDAQQDQVLTF